MLAARLFLTFEPENRDFVLAGTLKLSQWPALPLLPNAQFLYFLLPFSFVRLNYV